MDKYESLSHTAWDCKYHVVFIPSVEGERCTSSYANTWVRYSESWPRKGMGVEEGHLMPDHVHMMLSIPPKYSVCRRWWALSKARAQSTLRGCTESESATSWVSTSGREGTSSRRWDATKR